MDQPGEGKQLLNVCERSRESPNFRFFHATPQPVVVGPYMSIFELFYYLITSYITLLLFTIHYRHPLPPPALCRYARTP